MHGCNRLKCVYVMHEFIKINYTHLSRCEMRILADGAVAPSVSIIPRTDEVVDEAVDDEVVDEEVVDDEVADEEVVDG